ncbi:MAG: indolepyruvate ferredoxin oxidoreductase family protein [Pseudomonadota bacterium]|nr:indolepyruvate ferredoxin oxidoreductase family protein [Pseudomonadota bacterium]
MSTDLATVSLDDKYELESGRVFITGIQALIRLPMMQRQRDLANGLNTGCFISGYRGSPLGAYDQQLWQAKKFLEKNHIHFVSGVNEDLAATSVWGSQQTNLYPSAKYDGVFSIWYGKGPGVDRSLDVLKHMNSAGTSKHGGVLLLAGDDHAGVSSTLLHQSEHVFASAMIPMLHPASVQEYLDYGLLGWAMSRYSGCAVGFKCVSETVESAASVHVDPHRVQVQIPTDFDMPDGGLGIRWPDDRFQEEHRLHRHKVYAALAFARANGIDRTIIDSPRPRLGIITTGKSYLDVMQALDDLGITEEMASDIGIRLYKVGMPWPLEPEGARHFAEGLDEVLVIEEKRAVIENQLKEQLYNWRPDVRPRVVGKFDEKREWLFPSHGELTPGEIARVIAERLKPFYTSARLEERLDFLQRKERIKLVASKETPQPKVERMPYFCSGCPHNSSTRVPEGSRATAGIGCHFMAVWMDRSTTTYTQMGGEGTPWIGQAPFTNDQHIFANLGDGTYFHSGLLAVRASAAAGVNITYKILFNDAVAMTGGQRHDGQLTPMQIAQQVAAEGVKKVIVVSDEPDKYPVDAGFPAGTRIHHRSELDEIQKELRDTPGCTVLIYDQTCAAEKRRRRKRGTFPDPQKRAFINEAVCEGCGDCSKTSNCVSVEPLETEFGRKRQINQSSCNKDFSCVNGFCPSFVTIHGGELRKPKPAAKSLKGSGDIFADLPMPERAEMKEPFGILVTGIGGTGVLTVGALLGMAAHLEGKGSTVLDYTGLAQKNGAVLSHVRIADRPEDIHAVRIAAGKANLVLGCDMVVASSDNALSTMDTGGTRAIVNSHLAPTAHFTLNPDINYGAEAMKDSIREAAGGNQTEFIDATRIATALMGDSIATNLFMLGYAFQRGQLPVGLDSLMRAIELNGVAVNMNKETFNWGRMAAYDIDRVEEAVAPAGRKVVPFSRPLTDLEDIVAHRRKHLTAYQNAALADHYESLVRDVERAEREKTPGMDGLAVAVARNYAKLLAYKDEYEVARLYTDGAFLQKIRQTFSGDYKLRFHLAPPLIAKPDPETGKLEKIEYRGWILPVFRVLARLKGLRGTRFDIFGRTEERKVERQLIVDYEVVVRELVLKLDAGNHALAVEIASLPADIRGYGHIKDRNIEAVKRREAGLLGRFRNPSGRVAQAAE